MYIPKQWKNILDMVHACTQNTLCNAQCNETQEVVAVLVLIVQAQGCGTWSGSSMAISALDPLGLLYRIAFFKTIFWGAYPLA